MSMTDEEFEHWLDLANEELRQKQQSLQESFGLGSFSRWHFDQRTERLQFFDADGVAQVEAEVIDLGSYSEKSNTWKWAWANSSVLHPLRQKCEALRELETITGLGIFGKEDAFKVEDESMAWELAAMSIKHLHALGCYRAPSSRPDGPKSFLAITAIRRMAAVEP